MPTSATNALEKRIVVVKRFRSRLDAVGHGGREREGRGKRGGVGGDHRLSPAHGGAGGDGGGLILPKPDKEQEDD